MYQESRSDVSQAFQSLQLLGVCSSHSCRPTAMQRQSIFSSKQGNNRKVLGAPESRAEIKTKTTRRWDSIALSDDDTLCRRNWYWDSPNQGRNEIVPPERDPWVWRIHTFDSGSINDGLSTIGIQKSISSGPLGMVTRLEQKIAMTGHRNSRPSQPCASGHAR